MTKNFAVFTTCQICAWEIMKGKFFIDQKGKKSSNESWCLINTSTRLRCHYHGLYVVPLHSYRVWCSITGAPFPSQGGVSTVLPFVPLLPGDGGPGRTMLLPVLAHWMTRWLCAINQTFIFPWNAQSAGSMRDVTGSNRKTGGVIYLAHDETRKEGNAVTAAREEKLFKRNTKEHTFPSAAMSAY